MQRQRNHITFLLICTLLCLSQKPCFGQRDSIVIDTTRFNFYTTGYYYDSIRLTPGVTYTIYCPPQNASIDNVPIKLYSQENLPITFLRRNKRPRAIHNFYRRIMVYSGNQTADNYFGYTHTNETGGFGNIYYVARDMAMFLNTNGYNRTGDTIDSYYDVFSCTGEESEPYDVTILDRENGTVTIQWRDSSEATNWTVYFGNDYFADLDTIHTISTYATFEGLDLGTTYYYRIFNNHNSDTNSGYCGAPIRQFKTKCSALQRSCIDYTDLEGCATKGYYGTYDSPMLNSGIIDYGCQDSNSRHTVYTTTELDPRTEHRLFTLPPNGMPSVRLGNWQVGREAESLVYGLHVDTNNSGLLLVHYAVVLENPNHGPASQPKVDLQIVDERLNVLDPDCGAVSFYADIQNPGWNHVNFGSLLWKDWSVIGVDLSNYHDQDVYVKIENYDCAAGGHFGYCYFAIECQDKIIKSSSCGAGGESTLTAPAGFRYKWYAENNPHYTLGTERTFITDEPGTYCCQLAFPDGSIDCSFTIKGIVGARYPWANFSHEEIVDVDECEVAIRFNDLSTTSSSEEVLNDLHQRVDSVSWDFGDGTQSSERCPTHHYTHSGIYQVTLNAYLANGACEHSITQNITVPPSPCTFDTLQRYICANKSCFDYNGIQICDTGSFDIQDGAHHIHLIIGKDTTTNDYYYSQDVIQQQLPWIFNNTTFQDQVEDYQFRYTNQQHCDSIIHFSLFVHRDSLYHYDTTICHEDFPIYWNGHTFTQPDTFLVRERGIFGEDSNILFQVHESDIHAWIVATPSMATTSTPTITLSDAGNGTHRLWSLPNYTTNEQQFNYEYPLSYDSVSVTLIAYDNIGCTDTDRIVIPLARESIWIPNVFTPNLETNKLFRIYGDGFDKIKVYIYTREGLLVSQFTGADGYWDGTATGRNTNAHGGVPCPQGSYTYQIFYSFISTPNKTESKTGTITLLR